ncbi:LOW QUALITY PROTEIN: hypothetical protein PHMEG_00012284 [Phytophthora megakarya]|uniref:Reverse transcriptase n=1 Tax=Phytophthora megakarya TaxID=4795 RepID=A0A225WBP9_9STRA|nr:LOW QUALITY PROTEIN: hypothetical protein PHMEG_00012284 [Phytophthora megakarya]
MAEHRRKNFFDFVQEGGDEFGDLTATTRQQAMSACKRVRFADETSVQGVDDSAARDEPNDTPTEAPSGEDQEERRVTGSTPASSNAGRRRIAVTRDEELRWANLKTVLRGDESVLTYRAARDAWKIADRFVLSEDDVSYHLGTRLLRSDHLQEEPTLRLVVLTLMIQEVLQNSHDSLEGGHQGIARKFYRVKLDFYWVSLCADVARHVRSCPDCSLSKRQPKFRGYSPGNILAERPFQIVSMDFVIPLPKSLRGNKALLLFQCAITGFVMGKAMANTTALQVAQVVEECVYQRIGAPSLIRHDRDPRFMIEVEGNIKLPGPSERPARTVRQNRYAVSAGNWDDIAEKLIFAINNSIDATRRETPFYLVQGPLSKRCPCHFNEVSADNRTPWRREANRQHEIALKMAKEFQAAENVRRAQKHNESLSRAEKATIPRTDRTVTQGDGPAETGAVTEDSDETSMSEVKYLFKTDDRVQEFAYEFELPDRSGYRFYPVVHASRLKAVDKFNDRPNTRLAAEVTDALRLNFDEELLLENSWKPEHGAGKYEVEAILDDHIPLSTSTERAVREFKVKWMGYVEPTWEPASNLSCDGLLYDYLCEKYRGRRLQMVRVADED